MTTLLLVALIAFVLGLALGHWDGASIATEKMKQQLDDERHARIAAEEAAMQSQKIVMVQSDQLVAMQHLTDRLYAAHARKVLQVVLPRNLKAAEPRTMV